MESAESRAGRALVVIPTFNEADNIPRLIPEILRQDPCLDVLVVDDGSPDGTADLVRKIQESSGRVHLIVRSGKMGLGTAYVEGFRYALRSDYRLVFEMDADFSHDPAEIPNFLKAAENADLILGSRYIGGIRIVNWPLSRLMLSKGAATYVRVVTGLPVTDPTGGFKCFRREVLEAVNLDSVMSNGYAFQIEMTHKVWRKGFRVLEIPITFEDRRSGYSKMASSICSEAFWLVWKLAFQSGFRRSPPKKT
ncbi:MAG: polyprenol monophosphomannose synthase [Lentisphaerales bacterium]|nr:MAG: polyprenol monophosphomannose synthase [Lentisphaerales bacterium]